MSDTENGAEYVEPTRLPEPAPTKKVASVYDIFGLATTAEAGKEFELAPNAYITLTHASATVPSYAKILEEKLRPHRAAIEAKLYSNDDVSPILAEVYGLAVVRGWRGDAWVHPVTKAPLPYTPENFELVCKHAPVLFEKVRGLAEDFTNFRNELGNVDSDVKN